MALFQDFDEWEFFIKAVSISDKEIYDRVRIQSAVEYMKKESYDALKYITAFTKASDVLANFYRHGKWDYIDGLPEVKFASPGIVLDKVIPVLRSINNNQIVEVLDATVRIPTKHEWVMWLLQEYYGYDIGINLLKRNGRYYYYDNDTQYTDNNETSFTVTLKAINKIIQQTYDTTETYVVPLDNTTDVQHTVVKRIVRLMNAKTHDEVNSTTTTVSHTTQNIPKGTGTTSSVTTNVSNNTITTNYPSITLELPTRDATYRYIAKYTVGSRYKFWIYNPNSNTYPSLTPLYSTTEHEVYPIVTIRRVGHNINDDADSTDATAKKRYDTTEELLRRWLNLSLEDITNAYTENNNVSELYEATFLIGICPSDTTPIVANVLYTFFDYVFDTLGYTAISGNDYWDATTQSYMNAMLGLGVSWASLYSQDDGLFGYIAATYHAENYNMTLYFTPERDYTSVGHIGSPGTYTHSVGEYYVKRKIQVFVSAVAYSWSSAEQTYNRATVSVLATDYDETSDDVIKVHPIGSWITEYTHGASTQGFEITTFEQLQPYIPSPLPNQSDEDFNEYDEKLLNAVRWAKKVGTTILTSVGVRLIVKKQINATEVRTFVIKDMKCGYDVASRKYFYAGAHLGNANLVIPLPIGAVERLTPIERTKLMGICYYLFFWSAHHTHLAWYETADFGKFVGIFAYAVAAFVTLWSWGSAGPAAFSWAAAIKAGAKMAIAIGVSFAVDLLLESIDNIAIKIIAKAVTAFATAYVMGGFEFDASFASKLAELPSMAGQVFANDIQKKTLALNQEMSIFNETYQGRAEALAEEMKGLNSAGLSSMGIVSLTTDIGSESFNNADTMLFSPSQFRMMAIDGHRNYDLLYTGFYDATVHKFCRNALQIGRMPTDTADE